MGDALDVFRRHAEALLVSIYAVGVLVFLVRQTYQNRQADIMMQQRQALRDQSKVPKPVVAAPPTDDTDDTLINIKPARIPDTAAYKLQSNDGFEEFLAVQGVPWALRRAANAARPTHRITIHDNTQLTIRIEGIIESQTQYVINGPAVETDVRGRIFQDVVRYHETGLLVSKRALSEDYDVTVHRAWSEDGQNVTMTSTATYRNDKPPVQCVQQFARVE